MLQMLWGLARAAKQLVAPAIAMSATFSVETAPVALDQYN
jgi:hypothetical protein